MPSPFTTGEANFGRSHKPSCTESDLNTEDSISSSFQSLGLGENYTSNHSVILKQKFSSNNSNNVTFGQFLNQNEKKQKQNNLAYAICQKFPIKIKKQVSAIIDYYEDQLNGQRQMFWKMTQKMKKKQPKEELSFNFESSTIIDTADKDERLNELENKLMQKDEKIIELNKEITTLMTNFTRLKKQLGSSPTKSMRSLNKVDSIQELQ